MHYDNVFSCFGSAKNQTLVSITFSRVERRNIKESHCQLKRNHLVRNKMLMCVCVCVCMRVCVCVIVHLGVYNVIVSCFIRQYVQLVTIASE